MEAKAVRASRTFSFESNSFKRSPRYPPSGRQSLLCRSQSPGDDASIREQAKRLDSIFYSDLQSTSSSSISDTSGNTYFGSAETSRTAASDPDSHYPGLIKDLPLWRVQWGVFPVHQELLHVHVPHYCDMFNRLFAGPRPWRFGHVYLPGGSVNLGAEEFALEAGSKAPLVGTLMEVLQAVRFPDGRILLLAAGLGRFKVVNALQTVPHSRANVILLPDAEELSAAAAAAAAAADSAIAAAPVPNDNLLREAAVQHAAAAIATSWWNYELVHCRVHEKLAVIDSGDDETASMQFGRRLVSVGSNEVVELPWAEDTSAAYIQMHGPVHFDERMALEEAELTARTAGETAAEAILNAVERMGDRALEGLHAYMDSRFTGFNSLSERGVSSIYSGGSGGGDASSGVGRNSAEESASLKRPSDDSRVQQKHELSSSEDSLSACLQLEARIWKELDAVRALAQRISGRATPLAGGLQCLRPAAMQSSESTSLSELSSRIPQLDSTGKDQGDWNGEGAHPAYPALRRVQRLSFALASSLGDVSVSEGRQAWLEVNSIEDRLQLGLAALLRHRDVLAAVVAVRSLSREPPPSSGEGEEDAEQPPSSS